MRAHIRKRFRILRTGVLGRVDAYAFDMHFAFMRAAVEQIHIAQKTVNKRAGRVIPDLLRRADLLDLALVHQHHAVGDFERFFLVMRDENTGDVQIIMQAAQPAAQFFPDLRI